MTRAFVGLGSNAVDAARRLEEALGALHAAEVRVAAVSRVLVGPYEDAALGFRDDVAPVANAVAEVETTLEPRALLDLLQSIEGEAGRDRSRPESRALDLDLLDADLEVNEPGLALPHPRALGRAFVLEPWEEIAPRHRVTGTDSDVVEHAAALRVARPEAFAVLEAGSRPALPDHGATCVGLDDREALACWRDARTGTLGLVPTMGALHEGHETLLRRARAACDTVLATLFVNPLQFGPGEDLARYPRTFDADLALLQRAGVDAVYVPTRDDLYPEGFATYVTPEGPAEGLEGARRPGHFRGVATVVYKLWCRSRPTRAYFGQKDAQQLAVLKRMACDLELRGDVVACPTVREADGLALSSRNRYLQPAERERALGLSRALAAMADLAATGTTDGHALVSAGTQVLQEAGLGVDYLEVVDPDTMEPAETLVRPALAIGTVRVGETRLLDNRWMARPAADGASV